MKSATLQRIVELVVQGRSIGAVTDLASGQQAIIENGRCDAGITLSHDQLAEALRMVAADRSGVIEGTTFFVRGYAAAVKLVVVGAVHIGQALVPMARLAGFNVVVIDPRSAFVKASGFVGADGIETIDAWPDEAMRKLSLDTRTAVVTLTHDPKLDDPALAAALAAPVFYIGALGSRTTHVKRLARLKGLGCTDADLSRIHGPVGLDINAVTPAEIAVSIMAQVVQVLRANSGRKAAG